MKRPRRDHRPASGSNRIIAGVRAVGEALAAHAGLARVVVASDGGRPIRELEDRAASLGIPVERRERAELDRLAGGERHQGVVALAKPFAYLTLDELLVMKLPSRPLLIALDEITDPHNFGAIVRSAVALGAAGIITMTQRAAPVTPAVSRASAGATEHARIAQVTNLSRALELLSEQGFEILGLAGEGEADLGSLDMGPEAGRVLVVGSEGRGLRRLVRERCHRLIRIPMHGPVASLNASVAAAIAIYALTTAEPSRADR